MSLGSIHSLFPNSTQDFLYQRVRDPEVGGYKYIKDVANLGNDSPLLGVQQNGERSCDGEIELASNPPRFLIVEDESRCRPFNRQGNRCGFTCTQVEAQGLNECLILYGMNLHPSRQSSTTFLHHGVRYGERAIELLQDAERSGSVQRDQADTV